MINRSHSPDPANTWIPDVDRFTFNDPSEQDTELAVPGTDLARKILDTAQRGALTLIDEHALSVRKVAPGHLGLALINETSRRGEQLVWVDLGRPEVGDWLAQNFGGPGLLYLHDYDPEFGEYSRYDQDAVSEELDMFGTPSLPAVAKSIAHLRRSDHRTRRVIVLSDAWAARPYAHIRRRLAETTNASVRDGVVNEMYAWQAADFAAFARLHEHDATLIFADSSECEWSFWNEQAADHFG